MARADRVYKHSIQNSSEVVIMDLFWTVAAILVILWLLGLIGGIGGSLIHALLVIAVIVIAIRLIQGRNVVTG
jgi:hypothetical protein